MFRFSGVSPIPIPSRHAAAVRSRCDLRAKQGSRCNPSYADWFSEHRERGMVRHLKLELSAGLLAGMEEPRLPAIGQTLGLTCWKVCYIETGRR